MDTLSKYTARYARIRVENTLLRSKDTLRNYTASYARILVRAENIQQVTQGYVCKTYSKLHNQPSNTTCHLLLGTSAQYVSTRRTFSRTPYLRQYLLMLTSTSQLKLQGFVLKLLQISCSIQLQFNPLNAELNQICHLLALL
jgi:hypothetical protein